MKLNEKERQWKINEDREKEKKKKEEERRENSIWNERRSNAGQFYS